MNVSIKCVKLVIRIIIVINNTNLWSLFKDKTAVRMWSQIVDPFRLWIAAAASSAGVSNVRVTKPQNVLL